MITNHAKARFVDENKTSEFFAEVNWKKDPKTRDAQLIRFTFPDGKSAIIKKEALLSFLFTLGTGEEQRKIIPQLITRSRHYETVVSVEAKHDIKKGEKLTFPLSLSLPTLSEELAAEAKREMGLTKKGA